MVSSKKLKICKVESKSFAKYCIERGVDYLGVHVVNYKLEPSTKELIRYISSQGGKAVLVTKVKNLSKLVKLIEYYKPWAVQLHFSISYTSYEELTLKLDIQLIPVFTNDTIFEEVVKLLEASKIAIYDSSFTGGTNTKHTAVHLKLLPTKLQNRVLLAGGVNPVFVKMDQSKVGGYDVQSYCRENSEHHYGKAKEIIDSIKPAPNRKVAFSVTEIDNPQNTPLYYDTPYLEYQVDYSNGSLYKEYVVDVKKIESVVCSQDAPFALHIFASTIREYQSIIDKFMQLASNNILRIFIQYYPGLDIDKLNTYNAKKCPSIYYKDLESYWSVQANKYDCVSLILSSELEKSRVILREKHDLISKYNDKEVWFDRKIDAKKVQEIIKLNDKANFIVGTYIYKNKNNENLLLQELNANE